MIGFVGVSTHSRPKAAGSYFSISPRFTSLFQHTAARRRLVWFLALAMLGAACFNTQPPEGGWAARLGIDNTPNVSTHSRPKAAGPQPRQRHTANRFQHTAARRRLVPRTTARVLLAFCFNTQPPEGGWRRDKGFPSYRRWVSTHSRPKAAGLAFSAYMCAT